MGLNPIPWSTIHRVAEQISERYPDLYHQLGQQLYELYNKVHTKHLPYDDTKAEFYGGEMAKITSNNYEKALRNLWKAEVIAPFLGIHDASKKELAAARREAEGEIKDIKELSAYIDSDEFTRILEEEYTPEQRQALARLLSIILHGEAYALFTSASLIPIVKGTGPKLGMAMQVMEEAKHFIVMRALVKKIDRVYPQSFWDQLVLERVLGAKDPLDRLFGMNVLVESIAMNFFSAFATLPGLGPILGFFHLDESRHSAFPQSYVKEAPLPFWVRHSPLRQHRRMQMVLPFLFLLFEVQEDAETLGMDVFEFGAKCIDKIFRLSERSGFYTPMNRQDAMRFYNIVINAYQKARLGDDYPGWRDYSQDLTIRIDARMKQLEDEIFGTEDTARGLANRLFEPLKANIATLTARLIDERAAA